jgi:hypothetical protein
MTADDVRRLLQRACDDAGSQRAWALRHGVSVVYVNDVLGGNREPGPAILRAFGLEKERRTTYRKATLNGKGQSNG